MAKKNKKLKALGVYIFAGGFTAGVSKHFKTLAHFEQGPFGTKTAKNNFPKIKIFTDPDEWPVEDFEGMVDFVYANPPCAPFSAANGKPFDNWRTDERVECIKKAYDILETVKPAVWCFESVRGAYTKGRDLMENMAEDARRLGYKATFLLVDALEHGIPQVRKRFFMVLSKYEIDWQPTNAESNSVLADVAFPSGQKGDVGVCEPIPERFAPIIDECKPGEKLRNVFDRKYPRRVAKYKALGQNVKGRPDFLVERLDPKKPCRTLTGSPTKIHPTKNRFISIEESKILSGYDEDFEFVGSRNDQYAQLAKGLMPPGAEYLAKMVKKAIKKKKPCDPDAPDEVWIFKDHIVVKEPSAFGKAELGGKPASPKPKPPVEPKKLSRKEAKKLAAGGIKQRKVVGPGQRQPDLDRRFDKTQLKSTAHGKLVHRDYAAHYFRWGWAANWAGKGARILDVGCRQEQPLVRILSHKIGDVPEIYVGIDLNKIQKKTGIKWANIYDEFNVIEDGHHLLKFDHGTDFTLAACFEVIEHMHKKDGRRLLKNMRDLIHPTEGRILLSTPNYDGKRMAANHIHEYREDELQDLIEECGLEVERKHGTFMDFNAFKKCATDEEKALIAELRGFHSWEVLCTFLAPKYPSQSRNIAWVLKRAKGSKVQKSFIRKSTKKAGLEYESDDRPSKEEQEMKQS